MKKRIFIIIFALIFIFSIAACQTDSGGNIDIVITIDKHK